MNSIKLFFTLLLFNSLISCTNEEPETRTYNVRGDDNILRIVEIEDLRDGTGTLKSNLIFDNTDSKFDATFNYVNEETTNFVINAADGEFISGYANGNGFYTSDSIDFVVQKTLGGIIIEMHYTGNR